MLGLKRHRNAGSLYLKSVASSWAWRNGRRLACPKTASGQFPTWLHSCPAWFVVHFLRRVEAKELVILLSIFLVLVLWLIKLYIDCVQFFYIIHIIHDRSVTSSRLQLDVRNLSLGRRRLVNAYEVKAGIGVIADKTVWSRPERLKCEVPRYYKKNAI